MSHDINSDPEVWELTDTHGDRCLRVWCEILSISDRNEGWVKGQRSSVQTSLASKCRTSVAKVWAVLEFAQAKGWIKLGDNIKVLKYGKYHSSRGANKIPRGKPISSPLPNLPNLPSVKENYKRKKGVPPREEFLTERICEWAKSRGFRNPHELVEAFEEHHRANGSQFVDWYAAFQTWIRNDAKFNGPPADDDPYAEYPDANDNEHLQ